jgi:hypothetical protein
MQIYVAVIDETVSCHVCRRAAALKLLPVHLQCEYSHIAGKPVKLASDREVHRHLLDFFCHQVQEEADMPSTSKTFGPSREPHS